jgi:hypothetical protein
MTTLYEKIYLSIEPIGDVGFRKPRSIHFLLKETNTTIQYTTQQCNRTLQAPAVASNFLRQGQIWIRSTAVHYL